MIHRIAFALSIALPIPCFAHDYWANGVPVPAWVKSSCCGEADAHHLRPDQVHHVDDYWLVDGYHARIPDSKAQPSQAGDYWVFYRDIPAGANCSPEGGCSGHHPASQSSVYCFFVPMAF